MHPLCARGDGLHQRYLPEVSRCYSLCLIKSKESQVVSFRYVRFFPMVRLSHNYFKNLLDGIDHVALAISEDHRVASSGMLLLSHGFSCTDPFSQDTSRDNRDKVVVGGSGASGGSGGVVLFSGFGCHKWARATLTKGVEGVLALPSLAVCLLQDCLPILNTFRLFLEPSL